MSCLDSGAPPALDLLDEYWFFSNTLDKAGRRKPKPPLPSTSTGKAHQQQGGERSSGTQRRLLPRTPWLPSPRPLLGMTMDEEIPTHPKQDDDDLVMDQQQQEEEVDDDDLNWSSIYEGVLRTRIAIAQGTTTTTLHRAPSMPVHEASRPSMPWLTHSYTTLQRQQQCRSHGTPTTTTKPRREVRSFSANQQPVVVRSMSCLFQDKKWKSSSDLESIEVQGFKDLGFVFDKEDLRENLADVLPGLRGSATVDKVRRPYLSEAWHQQRSAPPTALLRVQSSSEARSAAEMKDQLRMWAQAVACNVRQES